MKLLGIVAVIAGLLSPSIAARAEPSQLAPQVGDTYEITRVRDSSQRSSDGSSGSSHDKDALMERVIAVRADGLELEYELPTAATADQRGSVWQFPARVFKPHQGPLQLLNRPELEARVDGWLKKAGWSRTACRHWIFTWNAFYIDCDPQAVIGTIEAFDLGPAELREGGSYQVAEARRPGTLAKKTEGPEGATFAVEMEIDPDAVRRARAESDVAVGEIMRSAVTLEAALRERTKEAVSGTISVTFETDSAGNVLRRTKVTSLEIKKPNDQSETQTVTETLERRLPSGRATRR